MWLNGVGVVKGETCHWVESNVSLTYDDALEISISYLSFPKKSLMDNVLPPMNKAFPSDSDYG